MTVESSKEFDGELSEHASLLIERLAEYPHLHERYFDQLMADKSISSALWAIINLKDMDAKTEAARARANEILGWDQRGC